MRNVLFAAMPLVAACSTMPPSSTEPPVGGQTPGHTCGEAGLDTFVGQQASPDIGAEILRASGARTLRWIPHDGAVTMDLRADRVNVRLDQQNRIESVTCG